MEFGEVVAQGAEGKVWTGKVNRVNKAIKAIRFQLTDMCTIALRVTHCARCDVLDEAKVIAVTNEVEISWLLSRSCQLIVRFLWLPDSKECEACVWQM